MRRLAPFFSDEETLVRTHAWLLVLLRFALMVSGDPGPRTATLSGHTMTQALLLLLGLVPNGLLRDVLGKPTVAAPVRRGLLAHPP